MALAVALVAVPAASAAPWGFEQVTPVSKGSGTISYLDTFRPSPDGNAFLYTASAPWAGIPTESQPKYVRYIGRRGPEGWSSRALDAPFDAGPERGTVFNVQSVIRSSFGLDYVLVGSSIAMTPGATEGGSNVYLRNTRTGEYTLVATHEKRILSELFNNPQGATWSTWIDPKGRGVNFASVLSLTPGAPENGDEITNGPAYYRWTPEDGLKALSVLPASEGGAVVEAASVGGGHENGMRETQPHYNAFDHFYFGAMIQTESGRQVGGVYERTGDETYPVSYSRITGDESEVLPARVRAVSEGGEYMLFETLGNTPLTSDTPAAEGFATYLYRYEQADKSVDYLGTIKDYSDTGQMTQDGETVVFQSSVKLTDDALEGEPNIYIWRNGELQLIVTGSYASMNVLSENGRYFSFTSRSSALAERFDQVSVSEKCPVLFVGIPGPCEQVYLFDAEATGEQLHCVSCRPDGAEPNGHAGDPSTENDAYIRMDEHQMQTVANDGTTFFSSRDGLLPEDTNELEDAYAYKDGELRLLSRAAAGMSSRFLDATYDGKTVFIATNDPIVGTDVDRAYDIYMTREGAGYPFNSVVPVPPCDGLEACRDGAPAGAAAASPGSAFFKGRGNVKGDSKARKLKVSVAKAKTATGATASLLVRAPGKGTLKLSGAGVKTATRSAAKATTYRLKATLTGAAKRALAKAGVVRKKVKVTFTPRQGRPSSVTLQVTYKAAANRKGN